MTLNRRTLLASALARFVLRLQIDALSAMVQSLARRTASSSVLNGITGNTGPNVSSRIKTMSWCTCVITVAG